MESGQAPEIRPDLQAGNLLAGRSARRYAWVSAPLRSAQDDTGGGLLPPLQTNLFETGFDYAKQNNQF